MTSSHSAGSRPSTLLTLLASAAIATTGCSTMSTPASTGTGLNSAAKIGGTIHGGNQPVANATVNLYFAGLSTFAAGATLAATTTSSADGTGSFTFNIVPGAPNDGTSNSFACPGGTSPYLYVVAKGGTTVNTPGAQANNDAEFIAPLGRCDVVQAVPTSVFMSEVVTVATMAALHQYMNPTNANTASTPIESTIGADGIFVGTSSLVNAFRTVASMANLSTGDGNVSTTQTGVGVTMTVTPELAKLNQLANIISSCINQTTSGSAQCQAIYASAVPPANAASTSVPGATFPGATDLLTALYYIFTNPTNGSPVHLTTLYNLSAAAGTPYQPTLTAEPTDWTIGIQYTASGTCTTSGTAFLNNPTEITADINGNLFVANTAANGSQVELNSNGLPLACQPVPNAISIVYDRSGNTWSGSNTANTITRYSPLLTSSLVYTTTAPVLSITADGYGDVFYSTTDGNLFEIANGDVATATSVPTQINSQPLGTPIKILADTQNRIWASSGQNFITSTQGFVSTTTPATLTFDNTTSTSVVPVSAPSQTIAPTSIAHSGVYTASPSGNSIQALAGSVTPFTASGGSGGLNTPYAIALDGSQNVWAANGGNGNSVSAFDAGGAALSPSTGFVKAASFLGPQSSIFVDASGNVWVGLSGSSTLTELVGAAVPVFQPYSNGLNPTTARYGQIP